MIASKRFVAARRATAEGSSNDPGTRNVSCVAPASCRASTAPARSRSVTGAFHVAATTATCARTRASFERGRPAFGMARLSYSRGGDRRTGTEGRGRLHRRRHGAGPGRDRAPCPREPAGAGEVRRPERRRGRAGATLVRVPARAGEEHVDPARVLALGDRALLPRVRDGDARSVVARGGRQS